MISSVSITFSSFILYNVFGNTFKRIKNGLRYLTCDIPENTIGFIEQNVNGEIIYDYLDNDKICKIYAYKSTLSIHFCNVSSISSIGARPGE
jgi:hypothetical protein